MVQTLLKFQNLHRVILGILLASLVQSVFADKTINVVTTTEPSGRTRHLVSGDLRCRLWEVDTMLLDFTSSREWVCSFDDTGLTHHFEGYEDKTIVGIGGYDMAEFFEINNAISGKTILVITKAEVIHDQIIIDVNNIVALEDDRSLPEDDSDGIAAREFSSERPRLKYPILSTEDPESRLLSDSILVDSSNLRGAKSNAEVGASRTEIYNIPVAEDTSHSNRRQLASAMGVLNTLVVRVNAQDSSPPPASDLSEDIFGDEYCLKSQYARCSYNKLTIEEYVPGNGISSISTVANAPGVVDVYVNNTAAGNTYQQLQLEANAAARDLFDVSNLNSLFDIVLFCMPPDTGNWLAYAYVGRWDSYYNNDWCQSMSSQMHEVGHNIGLQHSGEYSGDEANQEYGDQSGMMGFSYRLDDLPEMCFNPAKNWQLEWFSDKQIEIDVNSLSQEPTSYVLNGIVDYETPANGDRYIVGKIGDHYIGFNRRSGFNQGTLEAADQVTVHQKLGSAESQTQSKLVARLGIGQSYVIQIGSLLEVQVKYVRNEDAKDAIVEISLLGDPIECIGDYDAEISVEITTDNYPSDTSWSITDVTGQEIYTRGGYNQRLTTSTDTVPGLCRGIEYFFVLADSFGDGLCCSVGNGGYRATYNGQEIFSGATFEYQEVIPFILPLDATSSPITSAPTSSPTASPTMDPTGAPTISPTASPTMDPTGAPTVSPTASPTIDPTGAPTVSPTASPTTDPTGAPTVSPTALPTSSPTDSPTFSPTTSPISDPTASPTFSPTALPTVNPTDIPTKLPTADPTAVPTESPVVGTGTCVDDPEFLFKGREGRDCEWVAGKNDEKGLKTCNKRASTSKEEPAKVWEFCRETCNGFGVPEACPDSRRY